MDRPGKLSTIGKYRYRVIIPAGVDYKKRPFVAHYLYTWANTEADAIRTIIYQVGYPDNLKYKAVRVPCDVWGEPIGNKMQGELL